MLELGNTPTNLDVYYCENCQGIVATTDFSRISKTSDHQCPFCLEDSLVLLAKEDYENQFNPDLFPYPQNIILWNFFNYSENTVELLGRFSNLGVLSFLPRQLQIMTEIPVTHLFMKPDLMVSAELETSENFVIRLESKVPVDITKILA